MNHRFNPLHTVNYILRFATWILVFLNLREENLLPFWPAFLTCAVFVVCETAIWRGYMKRDKQLQQSFEERIATMPLFDLVEALNNRTDVKRLVINELEES